jgi:hypothetical protein
MKNEEVTTGDVAMPPSDYPKSGATWRLFNVPTDIFRRFETGRNKFERWSKYLDTSDAEQQNLYDYARKNRSHTVILRDSSTGALRSIRKRAMNEEVLYNETELVT